MKEFTIDQKLQRKKKSAITSVIIFLVLFVGVSIFQLSWNIYRFKFAKDGLVVLVDGQLAVGVEKIYRGEEATRILQKLSKNNPKPEEGNEFVLLKIKVQNISWWKANPRYLEFRLNTQSTDEFGDWTSNVGFYNPPTGEFKILDTSKFFKPGEVRDGVFCYEVENGKTLSEIKISSNYHYSVRLNHRRYKIPLSKSPLQQIDYLLLYIILFYMLTICTFAIMLQQRKRKSHGILKMFCDIETPYYLYPLLLFQFRIFSFSLKTFSLIFICGLLVYLLFIFVSYFVTKRRCLIQFCWLKKEDKSRLIEEFARRMQYETPITNEISSNEKHFFYESVPSVEVRNPNTNEIFLFFDNAVHVKNQTTESKKAKEVLLDIFSKTEIDWYSLYKQLLKIQIMFIVFFVFYLVVVTFL